MKKKIFKIAILITCHNRAKKTVKCLNQIFKNKIPSQLIVNIYLTEDGSDDGTYQIIKRKFPKVKIIKGDGNLFWAGGMRTAWKIASKKNYDYYLWLNDDVFLFNKTFIEILKTIKVTISKYNNKKFIISFPTIDPKNHNISTGGLCLINSFYSFKFKPIKEINTISECDTFNGNLVLITKQAFNKIGFLDKKFTHRYADHDYGLMARKNNVTVLFAPNPLGYCETFKKKKFNLDDSLEWIYFLKKHAKHYYIHKIKFILKRILTR